MLLVIHTLEKLFQSVSFSGPIKYIQGGATRETAPEIVYATATELAESSNTSNSNFNVTWQFTVDSSSSFLVRMHFCDIVSKALNQLYFNVYINGWYAVPDLDLSTVTSNSLATAYYVDFVVSSDDASGKLNISIGPSASANVLPDGILNGLEIMKMNISASGFDGQHFILQPGSKNNTAIIVGSVLGSISAVIIAFVLFMLIRKGKLAKWQRAKSWVPFSNYVHSSGSGFSNRTSFTSGQNSGLGLRFSFIILQEATKNFDENKVIGVGGFGKVYKGVLRDGTEVAAKRGNPKSQQGLNEFRTEIELMSRLRHRHLVSLIGFCDEHNEMILVYEYMEKGTLKSHLYGSDYPHLNWKQRLQICIGSAKGLHYLHTGSAKAIIHRDVKSTNILLDENLLAKVADFGLSKTGPELGIKVRPSSVMGKASYTLNWLQLMLK